MVLYFLLLLVNSLLLDSLPATSCLCLSNPGSATGKIFIYTDQEVRKTGIFTNSCYNTILTFHQVTEILLAQQRQFITEQESIPVGCVPSAAVSVSGGGGICPGGVCPGVCVFGRPPGNNPPLPWPESLMPVKTLPCPNYVAEGNYPVILTGRYNQRHAKTSFWLQCYPHAVLRQSSCALHRNDAAICYNELTMLLTDPVPIVMINL